MGILLSPFAWEGPEVQRLTQVSQDFAANSEESQDSKAGVLTLNPVLYQHHCNKQQLYTLLPHIWSFFGN